MKNRRPCMAKRAVKKKPSRVRYEQAHPTVSFRISRPTYERLKAAIGALGQSFGGWVKDHLDGDDRRASARAETLAKYRDGLGKEIERKLQTLARLEQQIKEREQQLKVPFEEEKARKLKEAERYGENLKASYQFALLDKQAELDRLEARERERRAQLAGIKRQVTEATRLLEMTQKQQAALEAAMVERVIEQCRKRPELFRRLYCEACPGYGWIRTATNMAHNMPQPASAPRGESAAKPEPAAHNGAGSPTCPGGETNKKGTAPLGHETASTRYEPEVSPPAGRPAPSPEEGKNPVRIYGPNGAS
jgi:hypothetical protein